MIWVVDKSRVVTKTIRKSPSLNHKKLNAKDIEDSQTLKGPLQGGAFIQTILKKYGKNGGPIRIEDLDENILASRLAKLDNELQEYKSNCDR